MIRPLARRQTIDVDIFKMRKRLHAAAPDSHNGHGTHHHDSLEARKDEPHVHKAQDGEKPEDINDKIRKMLAATEALKPGSSQLPDTDTVGFKRPHAVSSKVLKKISNVWAKIHTRNEGITSKRTALITITLLLTLTDPDEDLFQSPRASLRSAELRRNEDLNFNNCQKVWRLAGMGIKRKPLPKNSHVLRRDNEVSLHTGDSYNSDLMASIEEAVECTATLENPFDSEVEFEADLEGRILSAIPEASSTPRLARAKLTLYGYDQTIHPRLIESKGDYCRGQIYLQIFLLFLKLTIAKDSTNSDSEKNYELVDVYLGHKLDRRVGEFQLIGIKKHPSPDKGWLEALSNGFQAYRSLKVTSAPDEDLDELAEHFVFHPRSGFNSHLRHLSSLTTSTSNASSVLTRTGSPPSFRRSSQIPYPVEKSGSLLMHGRQARPFRPTNLDANNADELQ